jgi:ferric-dicitrate binding protein FerR (iron transport regulator)
MNYADYSVKDFILDESFQQWVLQPDEATVIFWTSWLKLHPEKQTTVEEAKNIIRSVGFQEEYPTPQDFSEVWENIVEAKNLPILVTDHTTVPFITSRNFTLWYKVAAVFLLFALGSITYLYWPAQDSYITSTTQYGETRSIVLPDSSVVYLNANSTLKYADKWQQKSTREVWLNGEAFFDVKRKAKSAKEIKSTDPEGFIVHTHQLDVVVLGTRFNVNERRGHTKVVLHSGKVKLQASNKPDLLMEPGELAELSANADKLVKKIVDTEKYSSWINNQLIFEDTPQWEIAAILKDNYGITIAYEEEMAKDAFRCSIPTDNIDFFFTNILPGYYDVDTTQRKNNLIRVHQKN